jgi:hypothetical protein
MHKKSFHNNLLFILIILILKISLTNSVRLLYPISFGIIRFSSLNHNLTTYMNSIGYPKIN